MSNEPTNNAIQDGGMPSEETSGLKKALEAERHTRKELERQIKAREQAEAEAKAAAERQENERKGEWEKLKASVESDLRKRDAKIQELELGITKREIERSAMEAISVAGGIPKALLPHLMQNLETVLDGLDVRVVAKGDPSKSASDLVTAWKNDPDWAWGFKPLGASGGGAPSTSSKPTKTNESISPMARLNRAFGATS